MRVLVADEFPHDKLEKLRALGLSVELKPDAKGDSLAEAARDVSILVVRSTEVPAKVFQTARRLSLVIRAGAGVNTIDVQAASAGGVYVANCPGQNALAVAELTLGLLLAVDRQIPEGVGALREGRWNKKRFSKAQGIYGRTLGLVGVGSIGTAVGQRAKAFGMKVVAYSRSFAEARAEALGFERAQSVLAVA
ncbi:MAG: NAD(P)-dependent oxidoreductase, partial [Myxococcaceae bacterium]